MPPTDTSKQPSEMKATPAMSAAARIMQRYETTGLGRASTDDLARIIDSAFAETAAKRSGLPHTAICYFTDGDQWCCVFGDFVNLQESPAGFGKNYSEALDALQVALHKTKG